MDDVILFHTHGLGPFDFSELTIQDLDGVDSLAGRRSAVLCPTIYLKEERLSQFQSVLGAYADSRARGRLSRLIGFSIEGPVLGPLGGIPRGSVWQPSIRQWQQMASWCRLGLKYIVIAPDQYDLSDDLGEGFTFADLLSLIYENGGRIAMGHFRADSPAESARRVIAVLDYLEGRFERSPYLALTDHLLNDMPRNFKHAFRDPSDEPDRAAEVERILSPEWREAKLANLLGDVPNVLFTAALQGRLTPAMNFDGGHVDLAICRKVVSYLGASRLIAMTDHTETLKLAGEPLRKNASQRLLYREDGVLAASAICHEEQAQNMRDIGFDAETIQRLFFDIPFAALSYTPFPKEL